MKYIWREIRNLTLGESVKDQIASGSAYCWSDFKNKDQFYFIFERWRQALHFLSRTSFHHSSGNIHIPRYRFSFYSLWIIDLEPNYHNRQNVDQLLKRNCPFVSFSNPDVMLGYIYPYHKTYKHWLNPHNCASTTGLALTTLLDICEWLWFIFLMIF